MTSYASRVTVVLAGKYHLERRLGMGGMAEVYLARSVGAEGFEKQVAIKRVLAGYAQNPKFAEMVHLRGAAELAARARADVEVQGQKREATAKVGVAPPKPDDDPTK